MNDEARSLRLGDLLKNDRFMREMEQTNSPAELKTLFSNNDLEMSDVEVAAFVKTVAAMNETSGDINDDELALINGGVIDGFLIFKTAYDILKDLGKVAWNFGRKCANWF